MEPSQGPARTSETLGTDLGQGVCKGPLKWFDTKKATLCFGSGRNVLLLQQQSQCCDFPTTNKPWGLWFTFSSFGLGFAASLMDRDCPARLVPYCNLNQTQPCNDTHHVSPQQTRVMDQEKLPGFAAGCVIAVPPVSTTQIYKENFLNMWVLPGTRLDSAKYEHISVLITQDSDCWSELLVRTR